MREFALTGGLWYYFFALAWGDPLTPDGAFLFHSAFFIYAISTFINLTACRSEIGGVRPSPGRWSISVSVSVTYAIK